ncbi:MAG: hypothetical protein PHW97_08790, partial [Fermentimonas sp.]|nr:hypothetical protein [Fermentimonas sp.]
KRKIRLTESRFLIIGRISALMANGYHYPLELNGRVRKIGTVRFSWARTTEDLKERSIHSRQTPS